jgi:hypothetical protein
LSISSPSLYGLSYPGSQYWSGNLLKVGYFEVQERAKRIILKWITGQQCIDTGLNWLMIETNSITDVELSGSSNKGSEVFLLAGKSFPNCLLPLQFSLLRKPCR